MTAQTLPPRNTPLTASIAVQTLAQAHRVVAGDYPSINVLALLAAQSALETGGVDVATLLALLKPLGFASVRDFQLSQGLTPDDIAGPITLKAMDNPVVPFGGWQRIPNYNFAGLKASSGDAYVQVFETEEVIAGITRTLNQTFAAYTSATDGAAAYVRQLQERPAWWTGLQSGTPEGFVTGLTTAPVYFTGNAVQYLAGIEARFTQYLPLAKQYAGDPLADTDPGT